MSEFVLLTSADCHLCGHGRQVLAELAAEGLLEWREIEDGTGQGGALARSVPPLRPVLLDPDGRVLAYGRLSARRLRKQLARRGNGSSVAPTECKSGSARMALAGRRPTLWPR